MIVAPNPALPSDSDDSEMLRRCENWLRRVAQQRNLCCILVMFAVIDLRLMLLLTRRFPVPSVHDEFSYLLNGDTFARGRLTNPPHPLSEFFETIHVNMRPTYASKYPPGQGLFLALGSAVLGHPWLGVLLSVGLMCGLICWAIQGWLPPIYGLYGGLFASLIFGLRHYWVNSYWGGAVAACGGAMVLGGLPRLLRRPNASAAAWLACGILVLANSRPYEGFIFVLAISLAFLWWVRRQGISKFLRPAVTLPAFLILSAGTGAMAYYNFAVTGSPTTLPYTIAQQQYARSPVLWALPPLPPTHKIYRDRFMQELWEWDAGFYVTARQNPVRVLVDFEHLAMATMNHGAAAPLGVALLFALGYARVRKITVVLIILVAFSVGLCMEKTLLLHYAAPAIPAVILLAMQGMRALRLVSIRTVRPGLQLTGVVWMAAAAFTAFEFTTARPFVSSAESHSALEARWNVERKLSREPGQHVVIVRYAPTHSFHEEIVYNGADIDAQKVVWAIDRGTSENRRLVQYYLGRHIWLLQPDPPASSLTDYPRVASE